MSAILRSLTWTRIVLVRLVLCGTDMKISRHPIFPILEVLHGLLDSEVLDCRAQPLRGPGPLLEHMARLHEVLDDPGGFGMAHLVLEGQKPELEVHEPIDADVLELVAPA